MQTKPRPIVEPTSEDLILAAGQSLAAATLLVQAIRERPSERSLKEDFAAELQRNAVLVEQAIRAKEAEQHALAAQLKRDRPRADAECKKAQRVFDECRANLKRAEDALAGAAQWASSIDERVNRANNEARNARDEITKTKGAAHLAARL